MSGFEKWRQSIGECPGSLVSEWMEKGWNARGVEDAKPQSSDTCPKGHRVSVLRPLGDYTGILGHNDLVCGTCRDIRAEVAKIEAERDVLREGLEDMVCQFAYRTELSGGPAYITGGLSALEGAFQLLGWIDPHPCPEQKCEAEGCNQYATCGTPTPEGYKRLCGDHYAVVAKEKHG